MNTFADDIVEAFRSAKIMGVRAGTEHRYTGVWVVVVNDRVFARSWNDKPTDAVTAAFGEKYPTKGSRKWVEGFAEPERVANTIEFIPS